MDPAPAACACAGSRFPRTRGDGPLRNVWTIPTQGLPPHARGWTAYFLSAAHVEHASPARAGMDRHGPAGASRRGGFPRTRGDGPGLNMEQKMDLLLPPHARGWTRASNGRSRGERASPARAGMDRRPTEPLARSGSFPRTRGDGPPSFAFRRTAVSLPPHARGWTRFWKWATVDWRASPARAGMDPAPVLHSGRRDGFPRTRGDGPFCQPAFMDVVVLPPHARGWTVQG